MSPSGLGLLDVLDQLPRDVLRHSVWLNLEAPQPSSSDSPSSSLGRPFRLACQGTRNLSHQLTRRLKVTLDRSRGQHEQYAFEAAVQPQRAFLAQQEGLEELLIAEFGEPGCESLITTALQLGAGAQCLHLRVLQLDTSSACTAAVGDAIRSCCPNLTKLVLNAHAVHAAFFASLRGWPSLSMVYAHSELDVDCSEVLMELAALPGLRAASLGGQLHSADVALLTTLRHLVHLSLGEVGVVMQRGQEQHLARALASLTQLTHLDLPFLGILPGEAGAGGAALGEAEADDRQDAVVAQLSSLRRLQSLSVLPVHTGEAFLRDGTAAALGSLTALTRLSCAAIVARRPPPYAAATAAAGGVLPLLQELQMTDEAAITSMWATLRLLRPLAQLRRATLSLVLDADLPPDPQAMIPDTFGETEAAAAGQMGSALAQAPHLTHLVLTVALMDQARPPVIGALSALLLPLGERLTTLGLFRQPAGVFDAVWPILRRGSLSLQRLRLSGCGVTEGGLAALVQRLPGLRQLGVNHCDSVSGATAVALAAARVQPLEVGWYPELDDEHAQMFRDSAREGVTFTVYREEPL